MLTDVRNPTLYAQWLDYIDDQPTKAAFRYIIGVAACSETLQCHIQWKGEIRDFRLHDDNGEQVYSFITNRHWLLFYFRAPALRLGRCSRTSLQTDFDTFEENSAGEWTVKIASITDVSKLMKYVEF